MSIYSVELLDLSIYDFLSLNFQISEKGAFLPFQVSDDMTLAPVVPPSAQERFDRKQLDQYLKLQVRITFFLN